MAHIEAETGELSLDLRMIGMMTFADAHGRNATSEELYVESYEVESEFRMAIMKGVTGQGKGFTLTFQYETLETK